MVSITVFEFLRRYRRLAAGLILNARKTNIVTNRFVCESLEMGLSQLRVSEVLDQFRIRVMTRSLKQLQKPILI